MTGTKSAGAVLKAATTARGAKSTTAKPRGAAKKADNATPSANGKKKTRNAAPHNAMAQAVTAIKAKRAKLPADFAAQYARDTKKKAAPVAVAAPSKKRARRKAADRENLRRAMAPDDDLLQRLARAGAIGGGVEAAPRRRQSAPRRSRKWESRCGKCGISSTFSTPAGLCARCGTIVVRSD